MSPDRQQPFEYRFFNPELYRDELKTNPLWYLKDAPFGKVVDEFIIGKDNGKPNWRDTRKEVVQFVTEALRNKEIALGYWEEYQNDDDRWNEHIIHMFPQENYPEIPRLQYSDTIVVHHTAMPPDTSLEALNAFQLMSLYVAPFRTGFKEDGKDQPIASGHFAQIPLWEEQDMSQQIFIAYHWAVREDGTYLQMLKDEYLGFQAGEYHTNRRSTAIVILDDLHDKRPTKEALEQVARIARGYKPTYLIGHGEVMLKTKEGLKQIDRECPGNLYYAKGASSAYRENGWKQELLELVGIPGLKTFHPYMGI